jgi:hypothetical protein
MQHTFPDADVKIIDYKSTRLALHEFFKRFKPLPGLPLFYYRRARLWENIIRKEMILDTDPPRLAGINRLQRYFSSCYDAMVVGMDVWCVLSGTERPPFPNIYWLPAKMNLLKIAYGVSAYNSDAALIRSHREQVGGYLDDFEIIAARDRFTFQLIQEARSRSDGLLARLPDPTFLFDFNDDSIKNKLGNLGVDFSRPLVGLLLYGDDRLSIQICEHYRARGGQVLALSMYNPYADINLGHLLTPLEWAGAFKYLSLCFSDRFHGSVFCLKNGIPFISLEKDRHLPIEQSKIYDLLTDFGLSRCYFNPADKDFDPAQMLSYADHLVENWDDQLKHEIRSTVETFKECHRDFITAMKEHIGTLGSSGVSPHQKPDSSGDE